MVPLYSFLLKIRPAQAGQFVKDCLGIKRRVIPTNTGKKFWADPVSVFGMHLLTEGSHESPLSSLLLTVLRSGDTFLDAGGNEGYFSVLASSMVGEKGTVLCIEPQTRLQPVIQENLRLNHAGNVCVMQLALSDHPGVTKLFLRPTTNNGASSLYRHWKIGSKAEEVPTGTVDSILKERKIEKVRLFKIDCEGAEPEIIRGSKESLKRGVFDFIFIDYHPNIVGIETCSEAERVVRDAGYERDQLGELSFYRLPGQHLNLQIA